MSLKNPKNWRFTWETQSQSPNLKLFLFNSKSKPSIHHLQAQLNLSKSHLLVTFIENEETDEVSIRVPIPRVLIDPESPVNVKASDDHIEVKLVLLLPVDHPLVSTFDLLNLSDERESNEDLDLLKPLVMDSDLKSLSSMDGVHFYCRSCSNRLTRSPLKQFEEMPSVNWTEMADNWFGGCCCSFGGASEKLVNRYAHAYACPMGVCMLNSTAVTLCSDDLARCKFSEKHVIQKYKPEQEFGDESLSQEAMGGRVPRCDSQCGVIHGVNGKSGSSCSNLENFGENVKFKVAEEKTNNSRLSSVLPASDLSEKVVPGAVCCDSVSHTQVYTGEVGIHDVSGPSLEDQKTTKTMELRINQRSFLNGFLGDAFIARSYNLSTDIEWKQFVCPQCSSLIGAYPCANGDMPVDDGVRLFKCYISTSLPVGGSADLFRKYSLQRMFTSQLVESAKDELSFRTVVRDLRTKSPMLQIVLVNPNSWCCSGDCLDTESNTDSVLKLDLHPVIKVLFSDCSSYTKSQLRVLEDWVTKNLADEVFMLAHLIDELIETIKSAKVEFPSSCTFLQGLSFASMPR
ncbi:E3 UBIQUITIN-PROTEIN LIGASE E3D FAMILY MEMBER [Salix viminalis]|uniref:E3 UBIQUITIN-PROTEIN LIGASE E3D FAMILY MEMBER n=1 Tax=Salix viminalis TaxID=40686 RepID=A0A9Q0NZ56_SALVM|nr:E3 UBIQUITIN-PROTEIN LIGASE E3D FAMILY MEMBER [Salix viminalis]